LVGIGGDEVRRDQHARKDVEDHRPYDGRGRESISLNPNLERKAGQDYLESGEVGRKVVGR
jgi:hypothetical protein